jgi:DNA processing protein
MASEKEIVYCTALELLYYNQPRRIRGLIDAAGDVEKAWAMADGNEKSSILDRAKKEMEFVQRHGIQTYFYRETSYPQRLVECTDAPVLLFGKGNIDANKGKFVSIVGTRGASDRGKELTRKLVLDLAKRIPNLTIVSGLAFGIDVAAHKAALEAGIPTIIIPAHGLDRIYPSQHRNIAVAALEQGGILTEYPSGLEPDKLNFVLRNRIIAGLADAVVVTESKQKGGSLITARVALDYGRNVYAVPGRPSDITAQGCNGLIRSGRAMLIETAEDLINDMGWTSQASAVQTTLEGLFTDLSEEEQQVMQVLTMNEDGVHVNSIVEQTGKAYSEIATTLMMLEMNGLVHALPGDVYRKV